MRRQEKVYFPRKARAPYFSTENNATAQSDAATSASALLSVPLAATSGGNSNNNQANHPSAWNEADAAAGGGGSGGTSSHAASNTLVTAPTTAAAVLTSPLRAIASVPRMPRVASSSEASNASRAAVLPTNRRSEVNLLSVAVVEEAGAVGDRSVRSGIHTPTGGGGTTTTTATPMTPDWRLRVRMRTVGVGLILALNIGTDPPDTVKPHPCAVLQCWMDPRTVSRSKAKEWIGERLEQQYAVWQLARTARPLRYRRALDPTVEDVRNLCIQLRRQARNE